MALEERFARRLRESCDDAVAAARRFEVRSVAVHQYVRDEVTGEAQPLVAFTGSGSATARQPGFLERGAGCWVALRTQEVSSPRYYSLATHPTQEHDVGEDHLFCWDAAALSLLAPPTELPVAEADAVRGAAFHRAPSRAVYRVLRPG